MSILKWLGLSAKEDRPPDEADVVRKLTDALDSMDPETARYLGTFAFILSRVANADLDISDDETRVMEQIVMERANLPEAQAVLVVQIAKTQNRLFGSTEDFLATREFKARTNREQRLEMLECLFAVSAADDNISPVEEAEIRKISTEIGRSHEDYVAIRATFRDKRSVLKE